MRRALFIFQPSSAAAESPASVFGGWLPLLKDLPGVLSMEVSTVVERPFGNIPAAGLVEVLFADEESMTRSMASPAGRKLAREIMADPRGAPELLVCEPWNSAG